MQLKLKKDPRVQKDQINFEKEKKQGHKKQQYSLQWFGTRLREKKKVSVLKIFSDI